jgi:hypothetical protein
VCGFQAGASFALNASRASVHEERREASADFYEGHWRIAILVFSGKTTRELFRRVENAET